MYVISPEHRIILEKMGDLLRVLRKEKKLSQKQMAFEMEISISQYEYIEKGKVNFGVLTLYTLAKVLEVAPSVFLVKQDSKEG